MGFELVFQNICTPGYVLSIKPLPNLQPLPLPFPASNERCSCGDLEKPLAESQRYDISV